MHTHFSARSRKIVLVAIFGGLMLILSAIGMGSPVAHAQEGGTPPPRMVELVTITPEAPASSQYYSVSTELLPDGTLIQQLIIHGPPVPPAGFEEERKPVRLPKSGDATEEIIGDPSSPAYVFGCSVTAAGGIGGKMDRKEYGLIKGSVGSDGLFSSIQNIPDGPQYPNIYTGLTNGGVMPRDNSLWPTWTDSCGGVYSNNPLIASKKGVDGLTTRGSIDDYWVCYDSTAPDPYITGNWTPHPNETLGDFMSTSQSAKQVHDGFTAFATYMNSAKPLTCDVMATAAGPKKDGTLGRKQFYESKGYAVAECYNQPTDNIIPGGFSYAQYKAEIEAGRPVMIGLEGHNVVGIGYDPASSKIYIEDGWDYNIHTMNWGSSYAGMRMNMVSMVNPIPPAHPGDYTISGYVGVPNATITYTGGSTKASISGYYSFSVAPGWSGRVTPSKPGYTFQPAFRDYTNVPAYKTKQNYTFTSVPVPNPVRDPSFEAGRSNPYWVGTSTNFTTPLCNPASCSGYALARTGSVWGWFGGTTANETATLSQTVTIPRGSAASLDFFLWIARARAGSNSADVFTVKVDGTTLFSANATQINSYSLYVPVSVNIGAYANGAAHTITFGSVTTGQVVSFHLDDVSIAVTAPTLPGAFSKSSPANGATNQPTSLTLTWVPSPGATSYAYCYDTTNDNACSNWTSNGAATSKPITGLSPNTTYYWHVRAFNSSGVAFANGSATAFWSFRIGGVPGAFSKSSPANGATNQPTSLTLTWAPSPGATSYAYCYDTTNDNACSNWTSNGAATSKPITGLSPNTTYYWHVRAFNSSGVAFSNGSATAFWSFRIGGVPGAFSKSSPANGATNQPTSLTLTWAPSPGATSYAYCYDTTNDNACSNWTSNGAATSKPITGLSPNTTYYWHVRAFNSSGVAFSNGSATAFWSFRTP